MGAACESARLCFPLSSPNCLLVTDDRSDAYRFAALHPGVLSPKCVGGTWLVLAILAFAAAVFVFLLLEQAGDASLSWWVYMPGPVALMVAILVRTYELYRLNSSQCFSFQFWLINLIPRPTKTQKQPASELTQTQPAKMRPAKTPTTHVKPPPRI